MENTHISVGTIARTACLVLALLNQILTATGHTILPLDDEMVAECITLGATVLTAAIAWWKNNSFTPEARAADQTLQALKQKTKGRR